MGVVLLAEDPAAPPSGGPPMCNRCMGAVLLAEDPAAVVERSQDHEIRIEQGGLCERSGSSDGDYSHGSSHHICRKVYNKVGHHVVVTTGLTWIMQHNPQNKFATNALNKDCDAQHTRIRAHARINI